MNTEEKSFLVFKRIFLVLSPIPFLLGVIGYYNSNSGESVSKAIYYRISDAIYNSICLYGFGWNSAETNVWLEIARWTAPLVTAAGLVAFFAHVYTIIRTKIISLFSKNTTAIYSKVKEGKLLQDTIKHGILCENTPMKNVKNHIILFGDDKENLAFYQKNRTVFENLKPSPNVYMCLNDVNSDMLKADLKNIRIFNVYDIIARELWKRIGLWNGRGKKEKFKIAIIGFKGLGQRVLNYGLQINLFSKNQSIEYRVVSKNDLYKVSHKNFQTMNKDKVIFHSKLNKYTWNKLRDADYVISTKETDYELLETLYFYCRDAKIFYYSPNDEKITDFIKADRIIAYGENKSVYTAENIINEKLYEVAKDEHYNYLVHNQFDGEKLSDRESEWWKLDGFTKGSNISSSDYAYVINDVWTLGKKTDKQLEELAELEHIRWCRYHFINRWKYGIPECGGNKDMKKRIHKCLCSYSELKENEKEKDRKVVLNIINKKNM